MKALIFVLLLLSCAAEAQQSAVVCPPHLSYCYKKPVLPQKTVDDEIAEIQARLNYYRADIERRARQSDNGLMYELSRTRMGR